MILLKSAGLGIVGCAMVTSLLGAGCSSNKAPAVTPSVESPISNITITTSSVTSTSPTSKTPEFEEKDLKIKSVKVRILESMPVQVMVDIEGELANSCSVAGNVAQRLEKNTFKVTIPALQEKGKTCTNQAKSFNQSFRLFGTENLKTGTYTVEVNGVKEDFKL